MKNETITIRINEHHKNQIRNAAQEMNMSMSEFMTWAALEMAIKSIVERTEPLAERMSNVHSSMDN